MVLSDSRLFMLGLTLGGNGEGKEDADTRAGAFRRPRGSLRVVFDMRSTEPGVVLDFIARSEVNSNQAWLSQYVMSSIAQRTRLGRHTRYLLRLLVIEYSQTPFLGPNLDIFETI